MGRDLASARWTCSIFPILWFVYMPTTDQRDNDARIAQIHICISLVVDLQPFYPQDLLPSILKAIPATYIEQFNDPLVGQGFKSRELIWFDTFIYVEL
jgi:hypothetical protein